MRILASVLRRGLFRRYELPWRSQNDRMKSVRIQRRRPPLRGYRSVQRSALFRRASKRANKFLHGLRGKFLTVIGASRARDALVHQSAAEIVGAGVETRGRPPG